jgi:hypothetical protein
MGMQSDVRSQHITESGNIDGLSRTRFKSISYRGAGADGFVKMRNGGANGPVLCELDVGVSDSFTIYVLIPGEGIVFSNGIYVELSNVSVATIFFG